MENLPTDIIEEILSRLSIEPTLQCKRVCRTWRDVLGYKTGWLFAYVSEAGKIQLFYGDQDEVSLETCYSSQALTKFANVKYSLHNNSMVGSCNGLVCLNSFIYNPVTGESLCFSDRKTIFMGSRGIGFGYLPSTNEYKVVRTGFSNRRRQGHVEVYTLGSQSGWRRKEDILYEFSVPGIFANGAIHWMCNIGEVGRGQQYKIVAFDLADENFKDVSSPPFYNPFPWLNGHAELMLLGGNLCFIHFRRGDQILDIWAFKKNTGIPQTTIKHGEYYGNNWSWIREFSIAVRLPEMSYRPFAITENNEVLLWKFNQLYCYNANTSTITKCWDGIRKGFSFLQMIPHMNTLVSIKDL